MTYPRVGDTVGVHYKGMLPDGKVFDENFSKVSHSALNNNMRFFFFQLGNTIHLIVLVFSGIITLTFKLKRKAQPELKITLGQNKVGPLCLSFLTY